jgi:hypothetical protein
LFRRRRKTSADEFFASDQAAQTACLILDVMKTSAALGFLRKQGCTQDVE